MCLLILCSLFPSLLEENRAFHKSSPFVSFLGLVHDWNLKACLSLSMVLLRVSFGWPLFLLPSGVHETTIFVCLVLSILNTCPNHFHPLRLMKMLILFPFLLFFILPPLVLPSVISISFIFSSGFYVWISQPCSNHFCSFSRFHFRTEGHIECWN